MITFTFTSKKHLPSPVVIQSPNLMDALDLLINTVGGPAYYGYDGQATCPMCGSTRVRRVRRESIVVDYDIMLKDSGDEDLNDVIDDYLFCNGCLARIREVFDTCEDATLISSNEELT